MIAYPDLTRYRAALFATFFGNVLEIIGDHGAEAISVGAQVDALSAELAAFDDELSPPPSSKLTKALAALDRRRDRAVIGISTFLRSQTYHFEPAKADAGKSLYKNLTLWGRNIIRMRYTHATGTIDQILQDWSEQPALIDAVTTLDLAPWVAELTAANTAFNATYVQRAIETAGTKSQLRPMRARVTAAWRALRKHLESHQTLTPSAERETAISELNNLIADYNLTSAGRTSAEKKDNPPTPENPPVEP